MSTQNMIGSAVANSAELPCMWLRGLLLEHLLKVDDAHRPSSSVIVKFEGPASPSWGSGTYYGDG